MKSTLLISYANKPHHLFYQILLVFLALHFYAPSNAKTINNVTIEDIDIVCDGSDGTVTITPGGTGPFTYKWSDGGATSLGTTSGMTSSMNIGQSTESFITANIGNSCVEVSSIDIVLDVNTSTLPANYSTQFEIREGTTSGTLVRTSTNIISSFVNGESTYTFNFSGVTLDANKSYAFRITNTDNAIFYPVLDVITDGIEIAFQNKGTKMVINGIDTPTGNPRVLPTGNYMVTVTGADGCTATAPVEVNCPSCDVTIEDIDVVCDGSDGTVTITPGGTGPFTYKWSDGGATSLGTTSGTSNSTNSGQSTESFIIANIGNSCVEVSSIDIVLDVNISTLPAGYSTQFEIREGTTSGTLVGTSTNTISSFVNGESTYTFNFGGVTLDANMSYAFRITNTDNAIFYPVVDVITDGIEIAFQNKGTKMVINGTATPTGNPRILPAGNYMVTVTDPDGCTATAPVEVNCPSCDVTIEDIDVVCDGGNGTVTVTPGGTGPFTYKWSDGSVTSLGTTSGMTSSINIGQSTESFITANIGTSCVEVSSIDIVLDVNISTLPAGYSTQFEIREVTTSGTLVGTSTNTISSFVNGESTYTFNFGGVTLDANMSYAFRITNTDNAIFYPVVDVITDGIEIAFQNKGTKMAINGTVTPTGNPRTLATGSTYLHGHSNRRKWLYGYYFY